MIHSYQNKWRAFLYIIGIEINDSKMEKQEYNSNFSELKCTTSKTRDLIAAVNTAPLSRSSVFHP